MTGITAYSTSGGSADVITTPVEETHPIDNLQDVEEAIAYANEALEAANRLEQAQLDTNFDSPAANKLLNVAIENYIERFQLPAVALENDDAPKESRLKKVILYLYAVVERIFKAIFDFFSTQKSTARKLIPLTKQYIGAVDSLSGAASGQLFIKDRSLMNALHVDGLPPKNAVELFNKLATDFEKQHAFSAVSEIIRLVSAAKEKNSERVTKEAELLRQKLEAGLKASLSEVNPQTLPIFDERKSDAATYYASEPFFGQYHIFGIIGSQLAENDTFRFQCGVRQDKDVPLRVTSFPVLSPDDVREICRTTLKICENIIRFSRDEDLLHKALREATFLTTREVDQSSVIALRNVVAAGQNSYIIYLRFTARTMQALMRWCAISIKRYENTEKPHG